VSYLLHTLPFFYLVFDEVAILARHGILESVSSTVCGVKRH
jgi:hypothetical protein